MKNFFSLLICVFICSCDDGDLQIETLDFDNVPLQNCGSVTITQSNVLFKLNETEALIMNLAANTLKNEVGTVAFEISATTATKISYRIFSGTATNNYFCDAVPPITPTVLEEIIASQAEIIITTESVGTVDLPSFEHSIVINKITLETGSGQRITDLTVKDFGTVTTTN